MADYEVGDIILANSEVSNFEQAKIVAQHVDGNWILEVTESRDGYDPIRFDRLLKKPAFILDKYYKKKPSFFELGKQYEGVGERLIGAVKFLIQDLYRTNTGDYAIAIRSYEGNEVIVVLTSVSFENMREVQ